MRLGAIAAILALPTLLAACIGSPYGPAMPTLPTFFPEAPVAQTNVPPPQYRRLLIDDPTGASPGTIVVDPTNRYLYLVEEDGKALRYGVGVGKAGMEWSGRAKSPTSGNGRAGRRPAT